MGNRGPIPKRSENRRRRNKPERETVRAKSKGTAAKTTREAADKKPAEPTLNRNFFNEDGTVKAPPFSKDWHPLAKRLWSSVRESGQSRFYQPSDWAVLYTLMDDLTYYKSLEKRPTMLLQTIMTTLTSLLLTEGDRRRLQIELTRPDKVDEAEENVVVMQSWEKRLSG